MYMKVSLVLCWEFFPLTAAHDQLDPHHSCAIENAKRYKDLIYGQSKHSIEVLFIVIITFFFIENLCCEWFLYLFSPGKWIYELMLVSKGVMQLGWCTSKCRFTQEVSAVLVF